MALQLKPGIEEFIQLARGGIRVPVWVEMLEDEVTPIAALRKFIKRPGCFLLESVIAGEKVGRYSFLGMNPILTFSARQNHMVIRDHVTKKERELYGNVVEELRGIMASYRTAAPEGCPGFCGGAVGYFGYEFAGQLENLPLQRNESSCPDVHLMFYDAIYMFDHLKRTAIFLCNLDAGEVFRHRGEEGVRELYRQAGSKIVSMIDDLRGDGVTERFRHEKISAPDSDNLHNSGTKPNGMVSNFSREGFCQAVEGAKEYIVAGDAFQIVLSQRFQTHTTASGLELYRALRFVNPSPYMYYLDCGDFEIIGSSPESHIKLEGDRATIRPIAGTRHRGQNGDADDLLAQELLADEKEKAEHIMLVDLARNDIGRVCRFGTVQVEELMVVERYSHVMHLVSQVTGRLREGEDALSLMCGTFPAGTVSGAPKIRAMELIAGMEPTPRGPYAGALGYISFQGDMDTAIIIRTMVREGTEVFFQVGAGIVADSDPESEYIETCNKARAMVKALNLLEGESIDFNN